MESGDILCFICGSKFPQSSIQNHLYKCKLSYETQTKQRIQMPEEYGLLFKTLKGGLSLEGEDLENFNALIATKSVKSGGRGGLSKTMGGTSSYSGGGYGGGMAQTMPQRKRSPARLPGQRPRMLVCPLCGKEFGTLSLPIHMKTCRQRFEMEQQNLPRNMRRSADKIIES